MLIEHVLCTMYYYRHYEITMNKVYKKIAAFMELTI